MAILNKSYAVSLRHLHQCRHVYVYITYHLCVHFAYCLMYYILTQITVGGVDVTDQFTPEVIIPEVDSDSGILARRGNVKRLLYSSTSPSPDFDGQTMVCSARAHGGKAEDTLTIDAKVHVLCEFKIAN